MIPTWERIQRTKPMLALPPRVPPRLHELADSVAVWVIYTAARHWQIINRTITEVTPYIPNDNECISLHNIYVLLIVIIVHPSLKV
jgi:hypothetical protein